MSVEPRVFTLDDGAGTRLAVMDWGATWLSCRVPAGDGQPREVLLGHAAPADYRIEPGYLGGLIGRYANRIANARFRLDGRELQLLANEGPNQLHGGPLGFDKQRWTAIDAGTTHATLRLVSPDGDQGFPGEVTATVTYRIEAPGRVEILFDAVTTAPCPVCLTSHAYFNLDGEQRRAAHTCGAHRVAIQASHYLPVDAALIPTGVLAPVAGSAFDLRHDAPLGTRVFDHCFVLDAQAAEGRLPAARIRSGDGLLALSIATDYPGLQLYTGEHLALTRDRRGQPYAPRAGFALEPQFLPDSPNHPEWPQASCVLQPGQRLQRQMRMQFEALPPQPARPGARSPSFVSEPTP